MGKALSLLCLLLTACADTTYESDFCLLAAPLRPNGAAWDAADQVFKQQIVLHNETGMQLCGWHP
jgi:hypothetical protein